MIDGNASIGMELAQSIALRGARDIHIYVPYGGGGLLIGIARAMRAAYAKCSDCRVKLFACEIETAAPLRAALLAGAPQTIEVRPFWIDGIGAPSVLPTAFAAAKKVGCASLVVSEAAVAQAGAHLINKLGMVVEEAGAVSLAAAWQHASSSAHSVCILSGGNIDAHVWRAWIAAP